MSDDTIDQAKRTIIGEYVEWVTRFDVNDYVRNKPMIEKLYEEKQLAFATSMQLEEKAKKLEERIHSLELENQRQKIELYQNKQKTTTVFILSLLATILVGIGVNITTSMPYGWTGWIMITTGCILEIIAFFIRPKG